MVSRKFGWFRGVLDLVSIGFSSIFSLTILVLWCVFLFLHLMKFFTLYVEPILAYFFITYGLLYFIGNLRVVAWIVFLHNVAALVDPFLLVFFCVFLAVFHVSGELEQNLHRTLLSYPITRNQWLTSKILIIMLVNVISALIVSMFPATIFTLHYPLPRIILAFVLMVFLPILIAELYYSAIAFLFSIISKNTLISGILTFGLFSFFELQFNKLPLHLRVFSVRWMVKHYVAWMSTILIPKDIFDVIKFVSENMGLNDYLSSFPSIYRFPLSVILQLSISLFSIMLSFLIFNREDVT